MLISMKEAIVLFCFLTSYKQNVIIKRKVRNHICLSNKDELTDGYLVVFRELHGAAAAQSGWPFLPHIHPFQVFQPLYARPGCVLSLCCMDRCSPVPAQHTGHNVLPEGEVLLEPPCCHHVLSCTFGILLFELFLACLGVFQWLFRGCDPAQLSLVWLLPEKSFSLCGILCVQWVSTLKLPCAWRRNSMNISYHNYDKMAFLFKHTSAFISIFHMGWWITTCWLGQRQKPQRESFKVETVPVGLSVFNIGKICRNYNHNWEEND